MITDYPNLALQHLQNQFLDFDSFFSEVHEKLNQYFSSDITLSQ
jgi:hypothetical protein